MTRSGNTFKTEKQTEEGKAPSKGKKAKRTRKEGSTSRIRGKMDDQRIRQIIGLVFLFITFVFLLSFTSFLFTGYADQSILRTPMEEIGDHQQIRNWLGKSGAWLSQKFIGDWFGVASFSFVLIFFLIGFRALFRNWLLPFKRVLRYTLFLLLWLPAFLGFFFDEGRWLMLGGGVGQTWNHHLALLLGRPGTFLLIFFVGLAFVLYTFNISLQSLMQLLRSPESEEANTSGKDPEEEQAIDPDEELEVPDPFLKSEGEVEETEEKAEEPASSLDLEMNTEPETREEEPTAEKEEEPQEVAIELDATAPVTETSKGDDEELEIEIEKSEEPEQLLNDKDIQKKLADLGEYDPTLDLARFKLPTIELLVDHGGGEITINREELEANKNRIVDTLRNYKIGIAHIKATIGPTVTLYEIVPEAGVRISKIKNLEDDIALSLSALGIRIIAPIPGRGTIGIEVPNRDPDIVSMRSLVASEKFQDSKMALPVALGKTINNETFVTDLAKMPHLLMAGATGQGKSVGLNAILVSLLYKLHPSQIKFVLVDPKKVELTLFNKIERHYLAKLPDSEEAIITDTSKVITTLNSLCVEMDQRYELLKDAQVRNLKEYNTKFKARKLNPENGHRYLPYIVLVVDEFADLIMTAGKEVETPIARLAQLARAIGIHLIIATQRPSVNVITGIIKANFPARIAFRVTSKVDSRTILDSGGADQLIGRGDMLLSLGSELIRLQCGFVDTPEVEEITEFIGSQQGYPSALLLPEYVDESGGGGAGDMEDMDRDVLFDDAARIVVQHQQGSASLLQRRLKLGYNRAGRLIDQLEAAGVVGPFEGSKARQVLLQDEQGLEQLLEKLKNDL